MEFLSVGSKKITNQELNKEIKNLKAEVYKIMDRLLAFEIDVGNKLQNFHDFMIVQQDRQNSMRKTNGNLNWNKIVIGIVTFLGTIGLVLLSLVQLLDKVVGK